MGDFSFMHYIPNIRDRLFFFQHCLQFSCQTLIGNPVESCQIIFPLTKLPIRGWFFAVWHASVQ